MTFLVTYRNEGEGLLFCCCDQNTVTEATYRRVDLSLQFQRDKNPPWEGIMAANGKQGGRGETE